MITVFHIMHCILVRCGLKILISASGCVEAKIYVLNATLCQQRYISILLSYIAKCQFQNTNTGSVVYFNQLLGAARTGKLVKILFLPFSTFC